jgi:hypothetical protein
VNDIVDDYGIFLCQDDDFYDELNEFEDVEDEE